MKLKLKDELTKLLIENPGISISELASKTGNYYSYTHKVVTGMEKQGLIRIEKSMKGNKEVTRCRISQDYKTEWVNQLKNILNSLKQDIEVKTALTIMYIFILITGLSQSALRYGTQSTATGFNEDAGAMLTAAPSAIKAASINPEINWGLIILICVPALIIINIIRRKRKY